MSVVLMTTGLDSWSTSDSVLEYNLVFRSTRKGLECNLIRTCCLRFDHYEHMSKLIIGAGKPTSQTMAQVDDLKIGNKCYMFSEVIKSVNMSSKESPATACATSTFSKSNPFSTSSRTAGGSCSV